MFLTKLHVTNIKKPWPYCGHDKGINKDMIKKELCTKNLRLPNLCEQNQDPGLYKHLTFRFWLSNIHVNALDDTFKKKRKANKISDKIVTKHLRN